MSLLFTFSALTMCCTAVASLLPSGGIKRTAMLVMGLTVLMMAAQTLHLEDLALSMPEMPQTLLTTTGVTQGGAEE